MLPSITKDYWPINQRESIDQTDIVNETKDSLTHDQPLHNVNLNPSPWMRWTHRMLWILVPCLLASNFVAWTRLKGSTSDNAVFSPAQSAIKYKNLVFSAGIDGDTTPYQGWPTPEKDQLWEDLFQFGVSQIPRSDAVRLVNRTTPILNEPGQYVVILSVFHQLHCLNLLRKRLYWNETEPPSDNSTMSMKHVDHCIDSIRQSLMCSSDITPLPFAWWPSYQHILPVAAVQHTCRDFGAIQEWAKTRQAPWTIMSVRVDDPLGNLEYTPGKQGT